MESSTNKDQLIQLLASLQETQLKMKSSGDSPNAIQFLTYTINNLKVSIKHTST